VCEYVWRGDGGIGEDGKNKDVWWSDLRGGWGGGGTEDVSLHVRCVYGGNIQLGKGFLQQRAS